MKVPVQFYSYFKELAGCAETEIEVPAGTTIDQLLKELFQKIPALKGMERSMLVSVGVEYQLRDYILQPGNRVALFPPVQGG